MTELIKNTLFWYAITRIKMHLEPLAFAANVTQAMICTVDTVLLTFGFLSIERRWAKCDQEIFIAAVMINPFYKTTPFSRISSLNNANIHTLLECLYTRFFQCDPPPTFDDQVTHYLHGMGEFKTLRKSAPNPLSVYDNYSFSGQPPTPFILLARHILTVTANSASCTLQALAELNMHICDQQIQKGTKEHLKQHFGEWHPQTNRNAAMAPVNVGAALPSFPLTPVSHPPAHPVTITPRTQVTAVDDIDTAPIRGSSTLPQIKIQELFDFGNGHWSGIYSRVAKRSFDEELDLYDLLDADADDEEDFKIELDGATEEVLCT
ncbi:hypothetical protein PAXRUDRAFT_16962 [Paxillus rubicundulus Ve08.2h10]|uniref:Uncharacterized protein n=1 Tax=Paxillus rubicundulus Ve08.2h10 TaxID=930991 RepID=A0A0D0D3W1_9AGAM|nr:hypothetical protein PAXRUDRAFT_16962 [Paxillus rubicundulus Ve08.2h10]